MPTLREVVLDTETTGIDHVNGDRIVEVGGIELVNHIPTGRSFHRYVNPERPMTADAFAVHGLSDEFLADKERFESIADELSDFLRDARLIAHNAAFDIAFLNAEFARTGHPALPFDSVVDTLALARRKHPNASNSLDALCARYGVDRTRRVKHGALLDSELLAEVYIELIGGRQTNLGLVVATSSNALVGAQTTAQRTRPDRPPLTAADLAAHAALVATLGSAPLWRDYVSESAAA